MRDDVDDVDDDDETIYAEAIFCVLSMYVAKATDIPQ